MVLTATLNPPPGARCGDSIVCGTEQCDDGCSGAGGRNGRDLAIFWVAPTAGSYNGVDDTCDAVGDGTLDYSYGLNPDLIESAIAEAAGVCGSLGSTGMPTPASTPSTTRRT